MGPKYLQWSKAGLPHPLLLQPIEPPPNSFPVWSVWGTARVCEGLKKKKSATVTFPFSTNIIESSDPTKLFHSQFMRWDGSSSFCLFVCQCKGTSTSGGEMIFRGSHLPLQTPLPSSVMPVTLIIGSGLNSLMPHPNGNVHEKCEATASFWVPC